MKIECAHWSCQVATIEICEIFWVNRLFFPILLNIHTNGEIFTSPMANSWLPIKLECFSVLRTCGLLGGLFSVCQKRWVLFTINFWIFCYDRSCINVFRRDQTVGAFFPFWFKHRVGFPIPSELTQSRDYWGCRNKQIELMQ